VNKKKFVLFISIYSFFFVSLTLIFQFQLKQEKADLLLFGKTADENDKTSLVSFIPLLSLESIFSKNNYFVEKLPPEETITLITTGDIIPARTVNFKMAQYNNFPYPFEKTAEFLKTSNLTLINLEAPLIKNCPLTNTGMIFCGDKRFVEGLIYADIDIVNLANNHALNYGIEGVNQTINLLNKNKILFTGFPINELTVKKIKDNKLGFLGWNLLNDFSEIEVLDTIKKAKEKVDLLIVSLHWGAEYEYYPSPWQKDLAHKIINQGADLIVGNHAHRIQPIEIYKNKLIIYAHGNFIFDQEWSQETKTGFITKIVFYQSKIVGLEVLPVFISDFSQPAFLEGEKKEQVINKLKEISLSF